MDTDLASGRIPIKAELGLGPGAEGGGFGTFQVGVENEAGGVGVFEEHHAHGWRAVGRDGGEGQGGRVGERAGAGVGEPGVETRERIVGIGGGR